MPNIFSYIDNEIKTKKPEETIPFLEQLSKNFILSYIDPENWAPFNNLAHYFNNSGDYELAEQCIKKALSLNKTYEVYYNAAVISQNANKHAKALEWYRKALKSNPNDIKTKFNMSMSQLVLEQWEEGWKNYDCRLEQFEKCRIMRERWKDTPLWHGENISDKKLVIFSEQGIGDFIQFMRFIPKIKAKEIVVEVQKHLAPLLDWPGLKVIPREDDNWPAGEPCDVCVSICSLPGIFNAQFNGKPYLKAPQHLTLEPTDKMKVGFCYAGNVQHSKDWMRSCPLKCFEPIHQLDFVQLYSLQRDIYEGTHWHEGANLSFINCAPYLHNFADTASVLKNLDLLITVDTGIAHLAGALGVPCWLLLAIQPDWRWLLKGDRSKWYDSIRLFRQTNFMDWSTVFQDVVKALKEVGECPTTSSQHK